MRARYACTLDDHDFDDFAPVESPSRLCPRDAATVFAEQLCSHDDEYYGVFEGGERVWVRCLFSGEESAWIVGVSFEPRFSSTPAKNTDGTSVSQGGE